MRVEATVAQLERAFGVEFHQLERPGSPAIHRVLNGLHALPAALAPFVDYVSHIHELPPVPKQLRLRPSSSLKRQPSPYPGKVTPELIVSYYQLPLEYPRAPLTQMATYEEPGASFNEHDLVLFQQAHNLTVVPVTRIIGHNNGSSCFGRNKFDNCGEVRTVFSSIVHSNRAHSMSNS